VILLNEARFDIDEGPLARQSCKEAVWASFKSNERRTNAQRTPNLETSWFLDISLDGVEELGVALYNGNVCFPQPL
jgi:hypothetical protein